MWVTNAILNTVTKIDPTTDTVIATGGDGLSNPTGIVFDGTDMWVTDTEANSVSKLRAS